MRREETKKNENKKEPIVVEPYVNDILNRTSELIGTKYRASVLEHQVSYLAQLKAQHKEYREENGELIVELTAAEVRKKTGKKGGSLYNDLAVVANSMTTSNMGYMDDENERFAFMSLVNFATYEKGKLRIYYPMRVKHLLVGDHDKYTKLAENIVMAFKRDETLPLYQLLKSVCYYPKNYTGERNNVFLFQIGLSELKLDMGVVNTNLPEIMKFLNGRRGTKEDYDRAVEISPDQKYRDWDKFNRQCLSKCVEEINQKSDIYAEYTPLKAGRGGEVYAIEFLIYINGAEVTREEDDEAVSVTFDEDGDVIMSVSESDKFVIALKAGELLAELKLEYHEIVSICEAATYNIATIEKAFKTLKKQGGVLRNPTGWMIAAIRDNYNSKEAIKIDGEKKSTGFNNFDQREYDEDELEKKLLYTGEDVV